ncbi:hypothetical protein JMM59_08430 [Rhodovulum sulfidophilum]|uniref:hypothetical protein n=1 Tax=Rhodovulum sulfidophilum TaxID=35806 RepID=UPI0019238B50|nr:hypothetical protein [Rhodovulum sulfidophilum]MBL3565032.1 hypothetical protein [Rhodovulum sulfidophilum]
MTRDVRFCRPCPDPHSDEIRGDMSFAQTPEPVGHGARAVSVLSQRSEPDFVASARAENALAFGMLAASEIFFAGNRRKSFLGVVADASCVEAVDSAHVFLVELGYVPADVKCAGPTVSFPRKPGWMSTDEVCARIETYEGKQVRQ